MPSQYSTPTLFTPTGATLKTAGILTSIAGLRPRLYGWAVGADGAPNATDCTIVYQLQLTTAAGTTTAVVPKPTDPAYGAAGVIGGSNATIEPTYAGVSQWTMGINQRASQLLWTPPNGPIVLVGTAANGIGMQVKSTNYTGQTDVQFFHEE